MRLTPKNWHSFQHYKNRNPPWIKLHKGLLDNYDFQCLPVASRALAPMLWLLASESQEGVIDYPVEALAFRLRYSASELETALNPLIDNGFFSLASALPATRYPGAMPETETETEREPVPGRNLNVGIGSTRAGVA